VLDETGAWIDAQCEHEIHEGVASLCKGGGGGSTTTVQQADPWVAQQPYLRAGFQNALALYQNKSQWPQYYAGSTVAPLSADTQAALNFTRQRALSGSPLQAAAQRELTQTVNGAYLNNNPYLSTAVQSALQPITRQYRDAVLPGIEAQFARSGRYGSNAYQDNRARSEAELARAIGDVAGNLYYQNYRDERGVQDAAMRAAPAFAQADYADAERLAAVGTVYDNREQAALDDKVNRHNYNASLPQKMLADYMALIQGNYGSSTSTISTPPRQNPLAQGISGALTGLSVGSMIPGMGSILGAGLGGLLGLVF
jgi:hypothetical protein